MSVISTDLRGQLTSVEKKRSDQMRFDMSIGGKLNQTVFEYLVVLCKQEHGQVELTGQVELKGAGCKEFFFNVVIDDAKHGKLEKLEKWCQTHKLVYELLSGASPDYDDAELAWWKPGMKKPGKTIVDNIGLPMMSTEKIWKIVNSELNDSTKVLKIRQFVKQRLPIVVPKMEIVK